jgi:hypothetical protein
MKEIAAIILENDQGEFLLALRDNKPGIPFPNQNIKRNLISILRNIHFLKNMFV